MTDALALLDRLRGLTSARIGLGATGPVQPMRAELAFRQAHAVARDAVWQPFDDEKVAAALNAGGFTPIRVSSQVADRREYVRRPDLGRTLSDASREQLRRAIDGLSSDVVFVVGDGLAPLAAAYHAVPVIALAAAMLRERGCSIGPVAVATGARVALGDDIGAVMRATHVVVLLGERPGLSAADSLGAYVTHRPRVGRTDAERNCISNIRAGGLSAEAAAGQLVALIGR